MISLMFQHGFVYCCLYLIMLIKQAYNKLGKLQKQSFMSNTQRQTINRALVTNLILILLFLTNFGSCQNGRRTGTGGGASFGGMSYSGSGKIQTQATVSKDQYPYNNGNYHHSSYPHQSYGPSGSIVGYVSAGLFSLCCCCGLGWICCRNKGTQIPSFMNRLGGNNHEANEGIIQNDPMHPDREFQRLKMSKNKVSYNTMTMEQFQIIKNQFINLIKHPNSIFTYRQNGRIARITNVHIIAIFQDNFLYKIQLSAEDDAGVWIGRGFIMISQIGPHVWWMKDYKNKFSAGQTGRNQFLIYESTSYNPGYWTGRWYFEGNEFNHKCSGDWSLNQNRQKNIANSFKSIDDRISFNN